jgi:hypothetical protein
MKSVLKLTYHLLILSLAFWACEKDEMTPHPQNRLEANAGADQQIAVGALVTLNGSASKDGNGKPFAYTWTLKDKPSTSTATLGGSTTVAPTIIPDVAGIYVVELRISNMIGFATDQIQITATASGQEPNGPSAILISQNITEDSVLEDIFSDPTKADYIVTADVILSAILTVKPGVRIEFEQDKGLTILGSLTAKGINDGTGTQDKRITFAGKVASKGYWKGLFFISNSPLNELENVTISHGGSSSFADLPGIKAGITLMGSTMSGSALKMSGTTVHESTDYGMYVQGMSVLNKFENNGFENNTGSALYVPARELHKLDFFSHYSGNNGFNGVETGGVVNLTSGVVWPDFNDGSGYYISSDIIIESGVRIAEGATLEFKENIVLRVAKSYMTATGTDASKITFTARNKQANGYWSGIQFQSTHDLNRLHYAEVAYAGSREIPFYPGMKANVAVDLTAKVSIENTTIAQGQGWGLVGYTDKGAQINAKVTTVNSFHNLYSGDYKLTFADTNAAQLAGVWLDQESLRNGYAFDDKLYDQAANRWFGGASSPWTMSPRAGTGLKITHDGSYIWTIIMAHDPIPDCGVPYDSEYITGQVTAEGNQLQFQESYWRSKAVNPCDASQSADINITPGSMSLRYEISKAYEIGTGEAMWELKFTNPDGTTFSYYKR